MDTGNQPGLDCLTQGHILIDAMNAAGAIVACWCLWCGGGTYDGATVTDEGQPIGWSSPTYSIRTKEDPVPQ